MGAKFWLGIVGISVGIGVAGLILFLLIGWAWYAWGFIGAFLFFSAVALALAYWSDRRSAKRYEGIDPI